MGVNEIDFRGLSASRGLNDGLQIGAALGGMYRRNRLQDDELELRDNQRAIDDAARDAAWLKSLPTVEEKRRGVELRIQRGEANNRDMSDSKAMLDLPDDQFLQEIDYVYNKAMPMVSDKSFQFGAQQTFKDSKGNLFFGTQRRDPKTGQVVSALSPVGAAQEPVGEIKAVNGLGLTASEQVAQKGAESGATEGAKEFAQFKQETIQQGVKARGLKGKAVKLAQLNDMITTGKTAQARKFMGDLFGVTDPDLGQFNSLAGSLVLDQIRLLGANPTEGERAFLTEITPSISQGGAVNKALIQDVIDMADRQIERARWFSKSENAGKTLEQYFLETDTFDFVPSYSGGSDPASGGNTVKWDAM